MIQGWKIRNFEREYPGVAFPPFRQLEESEADEFRRTLALKLGLPADADGKRVVLTLFQRSVPLLGIDATKEDFKLTSIARTLGIQPDKRVFIDWYRMDDITEFDLDKLDKYFDDIWYPGPDDIGIFDRSLGWMLTVNHEGYVRALRLGPLRADWGFGLNSNQ